MGRAGNGGDRGRQTALVVASWHGSNAQGKGARTTQQAGSAGGHVEGRQDDGRTRVWVQVAEGAVGLPAGEPKVRHVPGRGEAHASDGG